jgi:hypothetical protein
MTRDEARKAIIEKQDEAIAVQEAGGNAEALFAEAEALMTKFGMAEEPIGGENDDDILTVDFEIVATGEEYRNPPAARTG